MISKRLLNKLQEGKKYLITDGIGFYLLEKEEDRIWCSDLDRSSGSFFSIYMKSWREVLIFQLVIYFFSANIKKIQTSKK